MRQRKAAALVRIEVADRAAEGRRSGAAWPRSWWECARGGPQSRRPAADLEPGGYSSTSASAGFAGNLLGDVDRDVRCSRCPRRASRRAVAGPSTPETRAELDQRRRGLPAAGNDLGRALDQDLALATGRVVLLQLGYRLEELRYRARRRSTYGESSLRRLGEPLSGRRAPSPRPGRRAGGRRSRSSSGVLGEAEAGEDLAALRQVPVAEARPGDVRVGRPGGAAQHLYSSPKKDLRVLLVGEGREAGVGRGSRRRSTPRRRRRPPVAGLGRLPTRTRSATGLPAHCA